MAPFRAELVLDTINTTFQLSDSVNCMEWSPNGNILAMGLSDGSVSVFNLGGTGPIDSRLFVSQAHKNGVQCIKWCNTEYDADNKLRFATGGFDGVVNIWTISQMSSSNFTAVVEHSINNGRGWIQSLCWLPDNRIAVASRKQLTVWTASDNPSAVLQPSPLPSTINHVQYDPRLQCLVVCAYGAVTLICVNDANREPNILDEKGSMLHCESVPLIESPLDSSVIFVGMQDEISMVWIVSRDEEDGIVVKQKLKLGGYAGKVSSVTTDSKHRFLASTGAPAVVVWDMGPGQSAALNGSMVEKVCVGLGYMSTAVTFHPKSSIIAAATRTGLVVCWDLQSKPVINRRGTEMILPRSSFADPEESSVTCIGWSSSGNALACSFMDGNIRVFGK